MMSTKYTELSTSDVQLTCFAHLLTSSHLHWQILVIFSELLCANSEEKFAVQGTISQYRQSLCNALCSSQMLCLYVSGCGYAIFSTGIFL